MGTGTSLFKAKAAFKRPLKRNNDGVALLSATIDSTTAITGKPQVNDEIAYDDSIGNTLSSPPKESDSPSITAKELNHPSTEEKEDSREEKGDNDDVNHAPTDGNRQEVDTKEKESLQGSANSLQDQDTKSPESKNLNTSKNGSLSESGGRQEVDTKEKESLQGSAKSQDSGKKSSDSKSSNSSEDGSSSENNDLNLFGDNQSSLLSGTAEFNSLLKLIETINPDKQGEDTHNDGPLKLNIFMLKLMNSWGDVTSIHYFQEIYRYAFGTPAARQHVGGILVNEEFLNKIYLKVLDAAKQTDYEMVFEIDSNTNRIFSMCMHLVWNTTDASSEFCQNMIDVEILRYYLEILASHHLSSEGSDSHKSDITHGLISTMMNVCRMKNARDKLRDLDAVKTVTKFLSAESVIVKTVALLTLSYIITDTENHIIQGSTEIFCFLVKTLEQAIDKESKDIQNDFSVLEVLIGLNNLAVNDDNKVTIVGCGALPHYVTCLGWKNEEEQFRAAQGLWTLAFKNKDAIRKEKGCIEGLKRLKKSSSEKISRTAAGALWELEDQVTSKSLEKPAGKQGVKHVMISYCHSDQETVLWVKEKLKEENYRVWIDVDKMKGNLLVGMAKAVENAAVVIVCLSQRYQDSTSCRTEGNYAYKRKVELLPLLLERDFDHTSWLGILVANELYIDFTVRESWETKMQELIRRLKSRGRMTSGDVVDGRENQLSKPIASTSIEMWTEERIKKWLLDNDLNSLIDKLAGLDGKQLSELHRMYHTSPDYFPKMMREDFDIKGILLLKFSAALKEL